MYFARKSGQIAQRRRARSVRRHAFRAGCEALENRLVMTVNFPQLASDLNSALLTTETTLKTVLANSTTNLPIIGTSASAFATTQIDEFDLARQSLQSTIGALTPQAQATAIQQAIVAALDGAKLQHDHVTVSNYNPAAGNITIDLGLANTVGISQQSVNFNLGLPGVAVLGHFLRWSPRVGRIEVRQPSVWTDKWNFIH